MSSPHLVPGKILFMESLETNTTTPNSFSSTHRVEFADTDMAGIMHFSHFFRLMERTEHDFWRSVGLSVHVLLDGQTISWPRVRAVCDYKAPLRFEDEVLVTMQIAERKAKSAIYQFDFHKLPGLERVATGEFTVVCAVVDPVGGKMKAIEIPLQLAEKLAPLMRDL